MNFQIPPANIVFRHLLATTVLATAALLTACASVVTDSDPRFNVHDFHVYQLDYSGPPHGDAFGNPLNVKRLHDAVTASLNAKGLHAAAEDEMPDCYVLVSTGSRQVLDNDADAARIGFGLGWHSRNMAGMVGWDNDVHAYSEHRIAIDVYEGKNREPVWHASIDANVNSGTGAEAAARINEAVAKLFSQYP